MAKLPGMFALLVCLVSVHAQSGWSPLSPSASEDLVTVYFTSSEKGWVGGDNGFLASTSDAGATWERYPLNVRDDINEIFFRNDDNGYIVAGRKMFVTRNGGKSWQEIRIFRTSDFPSGTAPEFLSIRFSDRKRGYVVGSVLRRIGNDDIVVESLLMRSDDGGDTWRRIIVPTKAELYHVDFDGNSHGWVVGDDGVILATTDEGRTWVKQDSGTKVSLFNVDFRDDKDGYAVGQRGTILRTDDGGNTWRSVPAGTNDTLMRVDFADDKNGWIVGHGGTILRSSDKGRTWVRQDSGTRDRLFGLFMDKKYGWAVGAKGVILRYRK